ncbi:sensor histidine kinase [Ramlibacter rhizophilus]|uniref:sensor histidine kinase n=1 Tax=Ramlibacter rhizophilus TaxID=1781167 RepID=UPI001F0DDF10|nr:PAS domain-containing sensor histidine kinase [Ramlibacter rhizophilus]
MSVAPWEQAAALPPVESGLDRLWRGFANARVVVAALVLMVLGGLYSTLSAVPGPGWLLGGCAAYLVATLAVRAMARPIGRRFDVFWPATIGMDLVAYSALHYLQPVGIGFSPLFALPVLMASVLGSATLAFGTTAAVALLLLADAWLHVLSYPYDLPQRFLQAGLTGMGYFAVAALARQLAVRLVREEQRVHASQEAARLQAQVNELVIATLADGILVVDQGDQVRAANPTACALLGRLGMLPGFSLAGEPNWRPLLELTRRSFESHADQLAEVPLGGAGEAPRRVLVRTRLAAARGGLGLCVVFLEDLREMEARVRTEKLAAMGRMSAAVAHEIRNPLAAITQANALLDEELSDAGQRQLTALVRHNAQRLARIVEDVLNVSRVQQQGLPQSLPVALASAVADTCGDWSRQTDNMQRLRIAVPHAAPVQVLFDTEHLRRVLVNLLDNAARHAAAGPDSIQVAAAGPGAEALLRVWSDGPPLEPTVRSHLFEPFFSSESRSSGLGLYICRELCERHGAQIGYRRAPAPLQPAREGNEFFVQFRFTPARLARGSAADRIQA